MPNPQKRKITRTFNTHELSRYRSTDLTGAAPESPPKATLDIDQGAAQDAATSSIQLSRKGIDGEVENVKRP